MTAPYSVLCTECKVEHPALDQASADMLADTHDANLHPGRGAAIVLDRCCSDALCSHPLTAQGGNMCGCWHE
jgi:hypothetical protein